jgi:hypothetical protein
MSIRTGRTVENLNTAVPSPRTGLQARSGGVNETEQQTGVGRHNGNGRTVPTLVRG